jgi:CysZ protein
LKKISNALSQFIPAIKLIHKFNLWAWVLLPGLIFILIAVPMYIFIVGQLGNFGLNQIHINNNTNAILAWLYKALINVGKVISYIAGLFIFLYTYKFVFLIVCSPVLGLLSEKAEEKLLNTHYPFSTKQLLIDIKRGLLISLRNALKQLLFMLILLPLSFIPVVGIIFTILIIILDCYYFGFGFLDYNCERHKLSYKQSIRLISANRPYAIGIGAGLLIMLLIPVVGWLIGPGIATVAAMLTYINYIKPTLK